MEDYQIDSKPYAKDIYSQLKYELAEFYEKNLYLAGTNDQESARYLDTKNRKFIFNQWKTVNLIDLYYNSKFESGPFDSEGQRKLFLNICKFRSDVAAKQIAFQVKDFEFIPEEGEDEWPAYFLQKEFAYWAKENYFGELLNKCIEAFPKYGWVILKEVKGKLEFVDLQTVRCQQDAKSIQTARYFIIEHPAMTLEEMKEQKGWDTSNLTLEPGESDNVYERYGLVRKSEYNKFHGNPYEEGSEDEMIDCLTILTMHENAKEEPDGHTLFMEQIDRRPFQDARWSTQYGRLMGIGEVEAQMENQIGANMSFNLFRRQLLWSAKKVFQSTDDGIARNLVKDVKDGDVLQIGPNGNITQVDMSNKAIADFQNFGKIINDNADQTSFTFESSTGDSLPSGTPFRLGVLLNNTVNSHFKLKQDILGLFFKRVMKEMVIPKYKEEFDEEHIISMFADEEGFEVLKQTALHLNLNDAIKNSLMAGEIPDVPSLQAQISAHLDKQRLLYVKIPASFYDDIDFKVTLTITGDEVDIPKKIETLTNLYTTLAQQQDPRANKVLARILALTGENFDVVAGQAPAPAQQPQIPMQQTSGLAQPAQNMPLPSKMGSLSKPTINPHSMPVRASVTH